MGDVNGGGHACVGAGSIRKSLYLPLNLAVNLKLLLKKKKESLFLRKWKEGRRKEKLSIECSIKTSIYKP